MNGLGLANRRSERYELHGSLFTVKNFVVQVVVNNTFDLIAMKMFVPDCWLILTIWALFADVQGYKAEINL